MCRMALWSFLTHAYIGCACRLLCAYQRGLGNWNALHLVAFTRLQQIRQFVYFHCTDVVNRAGFFHFIIQHALQQRPEVVSNLSLSLAPLGSGFCGLAPPLQLIPISCVDILHMWLAVHYSFDLDEGDSACFQSSAVATEIGSFAACVSSESLRRTCAVLLRREASNPLVPSVEQKKNITLANEMCAELVTSICSTEHSAHINVLRSLVRLLECLHQAARSATASSRRFPQIALQATAQRTLSLAFEVSDWLFSFSNCDFHATTLKDSAPCQNCPVSFAKTSNQVSCNCERGDHFSKKSNFLLCPLMAACEQRGFNIDVEGNDSAVTLDQVSSHVSIFSKYLFKPTNRNSFPHVCASSFIYYDYFRLLFSKLSLENKDFWNHAYIAAQLITICWQRLICAGCLARSRICLLSSPRRFLVVAQCCKLYGIFLGKCAESWCSGVSSCFPTNSFTFTRDPALSAPNNGGKWWERWS